MLKRWLCSLLAALCLAGVGLLAAALPARVAALTAAPPAGLGVTADQLARVGLGPRHLAIYLAAAEMGLGVVFCLAAARLAGRCRGGVAPLAAASLLLAALAWLPTLPAALPAASSPPGAPGAVGALRGLAAGALLAVLALFPTGRPRPPWAALLLGAALLAPILAAWPWAGQGLALALAVALGLAAQVARYEPAPPLERQQIKWLLHGAGVAGLVGLLVALPGWVLPPARMPGLVGLLYTLAAVPLGLAALVAWPASLYTGALGERPWSVDFAIYRALVNGGVVAGVGGVWLGGALVLARGSPDEHTVTLATAAALAGLAFEPVRRALRVWVERNVFGIRLAYRPPPVLDPPEPLGGEGRLAGFSRLEALRLGGAGQGYRAQHPSLSRVVALKVLPDHLAASEAERQRVRAEAAAAAQLDHPHIAHLYEAGEANGRLWVATEYLVGMDLASFLLINGRLTVERARPILAAVAGALDYGHAQGQVHGDVRLANVMLVLKEQGQVPRDARFPARAAFLPTTAFRPVLLNWGLARLLRTGCQAEALAYQAPEVIRGEPPGPAADRYALGALAYLLLAGQLPFDYSQPAALLIAHLRHPPLAPRQRVPALHPATAAALQRAVAKHPADRWPAAEAFVSALEE